jgi:hypothetical protein
MDCFWWVVVRLVLPVTLLMVSLIVLHKLAWVLQIIRTDVKHRRTKAVLTVVVIGLMLVVITADWFTIVTLITRLHTPCVDGDPLTQNENYRSVAVMGELADESEKKRRFSHAPISCFCRFCQRHLLLVGISYKRALECLFLCFSQRASTKLLIPNVRTHLFRGGALLAAA